MSLEFLGAIGQRIFRNASRGPVAASDEDFFPNEFNGRTFSSVFGVTFWALAKVGDPQSTQSLLSGMGFV
jgi:hypothetical protein